MKHFFKIMTRVSFLRLAYLTTSFIALLTIILWRSEQFSLFGSGLMLGWDSPRYVTLTKELFKNGLLQTITVWVYPQLYVQLLGVLGYIVGNLTLAERTLPLVFAFLSVYASFLITLRISTNVHIAGLSALLQAFSISFLKIVSDNNRNLMAISLTLVLMLMVEHVWRRQPRVRDYLVLTALTIAIAMTQIETFAILSLTLVISAFLTRSRQHIAMSTLIIAIPAVLMVVAFPGFFLTYFQTPIQTPKQTLGPADLFYWIGGSALLMGVFALGCIYAITRWRRNGSVLSLLIFVWTVILLTIFAAAYVGLLGIQAEFGVRALLLIPSYVLVSLGVLLVWATTLGVFQQRKLSLGRIGSRGLTTALVAILVIAIVVANGAFAASESGLYFNTFIPIATYNKIVLATNYVRDQRMGVPIVVLDGSLLYASLYRSYIGALLGEHFAYFGALSNLLQLRPTISNSSDPYQSMWETSLSRSYLAEMIGNFTGPTEFIHNSHITDNSSLTSHTIVLITPELYDETLPGLLARFQIHYGIYVVPPGGLAGSPKPIVASNVTISRDNRVESLPGTFSYLDPFEPNHRFIVVNASRGFENYNITSFPSDWKFLGINQGGAPSTLEFQPVRPNGVSALVGNDPADSTESWTQIPYNAMISSDTTDKMEGSASIRVNGTRDLFGNIGLALSLPAADLSHYDTVSFWVKCLDCSSMTMNLVDNGGNVLTFYGLRGAGGQPTSTYQRFSINIGMPTGESVGFNLQSIASISFLAYSSNKTSMTLWIDDVVVQKEILNSSFLYKGRVLKTDQVEFRFEQRLQESTDIPIVSPILFYPPTLDIFSLLATTSMFLLTLELIDCLRLRRPRPTVIGSN